MLVEGGRRMPNLAFPRHDTSENTYNLLNNMANGGSHANRRPDHVVQRSAYTTKRYCDAQPSNEDQQANTETTLCMSCKARPIPPKATALHDQVWKQAISEQVVAQASCERHMTHWHALLPEETTSLAASER